MKIEELYGITKILVSKLHSEGIYEIEDLSKSKLKLPEAIIASAKLKRFEVRVNRRRAELEREELERILDGFGELILTGSYRRGKTDMKDLDFMLVTDSTTTNDILKTLPKDVYLPVLKGPKKLLFYSFRNTAIKIDLNIVPVISRAVALVHYTGSAENNIRMRIKAKKSGYLLNDKYILNLETGETIYPETEEEVFEVVGRRYLEPEDR